ELRVCERFTWPDILSIRSGNFVNLTNQQAGTVVPGKGLWQVLTDCRYHWRQVVVARVDRFGLGKGCRILAYPGKPTSALRVDRIGHRPGSSTNSGLLGAGAPRAKSGTVIYCSRST